MKKIKLYKYLELLKEQIKKKKSESNGHWHYTKRYILKQFQEIDTILHIL